MDAKLTEQPVAVAELEAVFHWPAPDPAGLAAIIHQSVIPFVTPDAYLSASLISLRPTKVTRDYKSIEPWIADHAPDVQRANFYLSSSHSRRRVSFDIEYPHRFRLQVEAPANELNLAEQLVAEIKTALKLQERKRDAEQSSAFLAKSYFIEKPKDAAWSVQAASLIFSDGGPADSASFNGDIEFGSPSGSGQKFGDLEAWSKAVETEWAVLTALRCWRGSRAANTHMNWDLRSGAIELRLERPTTGDVLSAFDRYERALHLKPLDGALRGRNPLEGRQRRYFTPLHTPAKWFDEALVPTVQSYVEGDFYIDLKARCQPHPQDLLTWQNIDRWRQFIVEQWQCVVDFRAYFSGPGLKLELAYDHLRERITIDVAAPTGAAADAVFDKLSRSLSLERAERSAWDAKTRAAYTLPVFANRVLAEELRPILRSLFNDKYALMEAAVWELAKEGSGDKETLAYAAYRTLEQFLDKIGSDATYMEATLRMEGPRGRALSVRLSERRSKLEIRSSEPSGQFTLIFAGLKRLNPSKVTVTTEETEKRGWKDSFALLLGLPMITAVLTGTIFAESFRTWITTKAKLEILSPESGTVPGEIEVHWDVQTERFGYKKLDYTNLASIQLLKDSKLDLHHICVPSGMKIQLPAGKYTMIVISCPPYGERASVKFEVAPATKNATSP